NSGLSYPDSVPLDRRGFRSLFKGGRYREDALRQGWRDEEAESDPDSETPDEEGGDDGSDGDDNDGGGSDGSYKVGRGRVAAGRAKRNGTGDAGNEDEGGSSGPRRSPRVKRQRQRIEEVNISGSEEDDDMWETEGSDGGKSDFSELEAFLSHVVDEMDEDVVSDVDPEGTVSWGWRFLMQAPEDSDSDIEDGDESWEDIAAEGVDPVDGPEAASDGSKDGEVNAGIRLRSRNSARDASPDDSGSGADRETGSNDARKSKRRRKSQTPSTDKDGETKAKKKSRRGGRGSGSGSRTDQSQLNAEGSKSGELSKGDASPDDVDNADGQSEEESRSTRRSSRRERRGA
ncbi:hypothetical protein HDU93_008090, partial [Gonapodya sp. JEL0774]